MYFSIVSGELLIMEELAVILEEALFVSQSFVLVFLVVPCVHACCTGWRIRISYYTVN